MLSVGLTDVNQAPTGLALSPASIDEHQPLGAVVGAFSTTDPDAGGSFSYALVSGPGSGDNAAFTIDASGQLHAAKTFNYEVQSSYSIRVRTTDQGGLWFEKPLTVTINDIPETLGTLLASLSDPGTVPQGYSHFGAAVAVDGPYTVVGTPQGGGIGESDSGMAYVFDTSGGALLATIINPTPATRDYFGLAVAVSGSTVVVGAYGDDTGMTDAGAAYVFDAVSGSLLRTLSNPTPGFGDCFGYSVAVSGNVVVVGAYNDDVSATDAGVAYVFDVASGNLLQTLKNPTPVYGDLFGYSVAVSGNAVVVGAYSDDTGAPNSGAAYVFDAASGSLLRTLSNPTPAFDDDFGISVAVSGSTVVVGADGDDTGAADTGAAYVFDLASGSLLRTLNNPTPVAFDDFGSSVAVSGSTVVVGAFRDDTSASDAGTAYLFDVGSGSLLRTLSNPTPVVSDFFGSSVAVSGNSVVVGAWSDDTGAIDAGSAYVFDAASGSLLRTLDHPAPSPGDYFGSSVAISGSTVVVGAYNDDMGKTDAGSAYLYDAVSGNLRWILNNPTPTGYDWFGRSVAVSGSTVVVGAYQDDTGASNAGSAYVFDAASGNLLWTLNNPTPAANDCFGWSVAVSGNTVVVGAYWDDTGATDAGAAYVFDAVSGSLLWTLNNPTAATDDRFGSSVAISGSTIVVGAYWDDAGTSNAGAAYVFDAASGNLLRTLNNPTPASNDYFGYSVAVFGNTVVVGAYGDNTGASDAGSAYVFDAVSGNLLRTLNNPTPIASDLFGISVAISGSTVVVGAYWDDTGASNAGSAYVFDAASGNLLRTLDNPTPAASDYFGRSVAVSGSMALVGAYGADGSTVDVGAAYLYDVNRAPTDLGLSPASIDEHQPLGTVVGTFSTTDPNTGGSFSYALVSGSGSDDNAAFTIDASGQLLAAKTFNYAVQSSYSIRIRTTDQGGLWFEKPLTVAINDIPETLGTLLASLSDPSTVLQDSSQFGYAVAVDGPYTVVGTPYADVLGRTDAGRAYVFDTGSGNLLWTLNNPPPANFDFFGCSVAVSGSTVVVGATGGSTGATIGGLAYVFDAVSGSLLQTLSNPTPADSDYFGDCVAVSGTTVVVGASGDDTGATDAGSAYVFDAVSGDLLRTLSSPSSAAYDFFGRSVAVSGNTVVVGAQGDDTGATGAGAAYVFDAASGNLRWTLQNPSPTAYDLFGCSVAVSGSTVVVGAYQDDLGATNAGAAYVFDAASGSLLRTLVNPTPAADGYFGYSVAVSGSTVVVGAYGDDTGASDAGAAYVFDAASGNLLRTLDNPTPAASDWFGWSVAVSGSTVVVGAYQDDAGATDAGSAHVFDAVSGTLLRTLSNPTPAVGDYFGYSLAVSGSTVVVGAYSDDTGASNAGSAYVFDAASGTLLWTLNNPTPAASDWFGYSVAVSGSTVVVGAYHDDTGATDAGAVYVFDAASGSLLRTLSNPTPATGDHFGSTVAVYGTTVVVGAYRDDTGATDVGAAYVFDLLTGNLLWTLDNPTPAAGDYFGSSVAVYGNTVVVGAYQDDTGATNAGSAYVFDAASGSLLRTLNNPTAAADDRFGSAVAISGSTIVVGAYYDDTGATNAGSAYVFSAISGALLRTLNNPTPAANDSFGASVSISGSTVVVGARYDDTDATDAGAAYVFDAISGNLLKTLNSPTPAAGNLFGIAVAVSGSRAIVGASGVDGGTIDRGAAYLFDVNQAPTDLALSAATIAENQPAGVPVGDLLTTDPNLPDDAHTYTLLDSAGGRFKIVGSQVQVDNGSLLDYEAATSYNITIRTTDLGGLSYDKTLTINVTNVPEVQSRLVFYNNSAFDGNDAAANAADDTAIAIDKTPLLPGGTATTANYTSYVRGINGVMVDIDHLPAQLAAADFEFRVGNDNSPGAWSLAPTPTVSIRWGAGALLPDGVTHADRVTLTWEDYSVLQAGVWVRNSSGIGQCWLQIVVKANVQTGLAQDDVFYFGNAIGESGDSATSAAVNIVDFGGARDNPHNAFNRASITDPYDFDRDQFVNIVDLGLVRDNGTNAFSDLNLITAPAGPSLMAAATAGALVDAAGSSPVLAVRITRGADGSVTALSSGPSAPLLESADAQHLATLEALPARASSLASTADAAARDAALSQTVAWSDAPADESEALIGKSAGVSVLPTAKVAVRRR